MAEVTKYELITNNNNNNNDNKNIITDIKTYFSIFKTTKNSNFIYGVVLVFVLFTVFLAFSPSTTSSNSPWFVNIFSVNSTTTSSHSPPVNRPDRSSSNTNYPSVYSYFFPNSSSVSPSGSNRNNATFNLPVSEKNGTEEVLSRDDYNVTKNSTIAPLSGLNSSDLGAVKENVTSGGKNSTVAPQVESSSSDLGNGGGNSSVVPQIQANTTKISGGVVLKSSDLGNGGENSTISPQFQSNKTENGGGVGLKSSNLGNGGENSTISPQIQSNSTKTGGGVVLKSSDLGNGGENSTISPQIQPNTTATGGGVVLKSSDLADSSENSTIATQIQSNSTNLAPSLDSGSKGSSIAPKTQSNTTGKGDGVEVNSSDLTASLPKNDKNKDENEVGNLVGCDLYDGGWVKDESYPLYKPGSCKLVDEQFNCVLNGRPDHDYYKLKWKPNGCSIPRLNGGNMLELLKGKRLVFVGDSLNRNMWESLVCILKNSVKDKTKVYEAYGRHHFRTEASYSFVFKDYNCTVEFFVSPFLVQQWELKDKSGTTQETLRLDLMVSDADQFKTADYIVFNTGHWWTHDKTSKGEDYYQEGSHVYKQLDVTEAFRRAITTWGRWVDANIDPKRTHVLFRGYSASHFSGGQWNSGGQCDSETEPIKNETYLTEYPLKMKVFESVIKGMKTHVSYLNVTRLTDYRKDGHPSVYRKLEKKSPLRFQDCSHWCLPGVPDSWNELLFAELLRKHYIDQHVNRT